jgi:hypothetical protein
MSITIVAAYIYGAKGDDVQYSSNTNEDTKIATKQNELLLSALQTSHHKYKYMYKLLQCLSSSSRPNREISMTLKEKEPGNMQRYPPN